MVNGVRDGSQDKGWNPAIRGRLVDGQGRCVHWHSPLDVVANRFACCDEYYACYRCMMNWLDMIASRGETWIRSL